MSYETLIKNISVGRDTQYPNNNLTENQAIELLRMVATKLNLSRLDSKRECYEGDKYFAYVGSFPVFHLALDNKSGTSRLYTITTKEELEKIK